METIIPQYKKALVIFIDILGTQNQNDFERLYEINNTFHATLIGNERNNKEKLSYQRTIHTFSDCAYIIYDFKDDVPHERQKLELLFEVALCNCEPLLLNFLSKKFLFRGGVAYGDIYYEKDRSILFGPAVNEAYQLENKVAIYPRIVLSKEVGETIVEYWRRCVCEADNPTTEQEKIQYTLIGNIRKLQGCIVTRDFDGMYMLHYLNSIKMNIGVQTFTHMSNKQFVESCKQFCYSQIQLNAGKDYIIQKYDWLLTYISSVTEYGLI